MFFDAYCSNCGKKIKFDSDRQFMFCSYCGAKIAAPVSGGNMSVMNNGAAPANAANADFYNNSLISLASSYEAAGNFQAALDIYNKILYNDPTNAEAIAATARINTVLNTPNIIISRVPYDVSGINALPVRLKSSSRIFYPVRYLHPGETLTYSVPPASYSLYLGKTGPRFSIADRYTTVKYSVSIFGSRVHATREF